MNELTAHRPTFSMCHLRGAGTEPSGAAKNWLDSVVVIRVIQYDKSSKGILDDVISWGILAYLK